MTNLRVTVATILLIVVALTAWSGQPAQADEVTPAAAHPAAAQLAAQISELGSVSLIVGLDMPGYDPALFDVAVPNEVGDGESNSATVVVSQTDSSVQQQVPVTTVAQRTPAGQPNLLFLPTIFSERSGHTLRAQITGLAVADGRYGIRVTTSGYTPALPGQHIHFFFDTVAPEEAGAPGAGVWHVHGSLADYRGVTLAERPAAATQLCVLVANPDHSVQLASGNCVNLP